MAPLNAGDEGRLVSPIGLVLMLVTVLAALWFLLPEQARYQTRQALEKPDALSIAYLRAVLQSDPQRDDLRLKLVRRLLTIGRLDEAGRLLAERQPESADLAMAARMLRLELRLRQAITAPATARTGLLKAVRSLLNELPSHPVVIRELTRLPDLALQAGEPALAADIARRLARSSDAQTASRWWRRAGRWALAAGDPLAASDDYTRAAKTGKDGPHLAMRAIDAALAAGQPRRALALARRFLERWPNDPELLARSVTVALQVSRIEEAERWNQRYLIRRPDDIDALRRQRDIALARGRLGTAARLARRIVSHPAAGRDDRTHLARILEWNGDPAAAMAVWQRLADGRPEVEREVRRLARMLLDIDAEIDSLRRQQRRAGTLTRDDWLRLARLLERRGEPERALTVLTELLDRFPNDAESRRLRLTLLVQVGRADEALALLDAQARRQGIDDKLRRQRIAILWQSLREREAWEESRRLQQPLAFEDPADGALHAELAWRHGDYVLAERLYTRLYERYAARTLSPSDADSQTRERIRLIHERLIRLADERGDVPRASEVGLHGWRQLGDPDLLWQSLQVAVHHHDQHAMERLLKLALAQPDRYGRLDAAMLELATWKHRHGHVREAEALYQALLARNPQAEETRLGLLWLFVDTRQHKPLRRYLLAWQRDALDDSRYWSVFAAGWTVLDEPARALPWIERRVRLTPGDPLWLLTWADTLDALGRRDSAWRVRRHALNLGADALSQSLHSGRKLNEADEALLYALRREYGLPRIDSVVSALSPQQLDAVFLAGWYLSSERDDRARHWLLRQQQMRLAQPAWQRISLALLDNDTARMADLLEDPGLSSLDRIRGLTRLGRRSEALALALDQVRPETGLANRHAATVWAAELYRDLPTTLSAALLNRRIGQLDIPGQAATLRFSRRNLSLHARLENHRLNIDPARYDLSGRDTERILAGGLEWLGRRQRMWIELGRHQRPDRSTLLARLGWRTRLARQGELRIEGGQGLRSEASETIRADGLKDELRLAWYQPLTARTTFHLGLGRRDFRSRSDQMLARGRFVDASLGEHLALGTNTLQVRLQGTWLDNELADGLPPDMAARLPAGAGVADVIPPWYTSLGIGIALNRGQPADRAPRVGGLRYALDAWIGPVWPERRLGYAFHAAVGSRLLGSDELALSLTYSDVLNVIAGQTNASVQLQYRYFFGR